MNRARPRRRSPYLGLLCAALGSTCATAPSPTTAPTAEAAPTTRRESLAIDGIDLDLYLPSSAAPPLSAVLVFHAAMGPTDAVRGYADALAQDGFAVCVLDFYGGRVAEAPEQARALRDEANGRVPALTSLVQGAYEALRSDPRVLARRRYLLGWSFGGAWATYAAGFLDHVAGVVAIYGEAFGDDPTLIERFSVPLLLLGATRDSDPTTEALQEIRDGLAGRGVPVSVVLVDAEHGFMEPRHRGYARQPAERAWTTAVEFLEALEAHPPAR
ncbi:MAG: dienelactone hydrolase family protein [Myxococcales bacterium]|nr:dienelactone hydrolase family protein [Myxococcales bacterium]MCB9716433.1 dienelactone hydrolase family protein [Myxococcales bacterium]